MGMNKIGTLLVGIAFVAAGIWMMTEEPYPFDTRALYRHTKSIHGQTYYNKIESGAELAAHEPARVTHVKIFGVILIVLGSVPLWFYYKDYIAKTK